MEMQILDLQYDLNLVKLFWFVGVLFALFTSQYLLISFNVVES